MRNQLILLLLLCSYAAGVVQITTNSVPNGAANASYSETIDTSKGEVPFDWSVSAESLPAGLSLTPSADTRSATISGTPTTAGTYDFSISVKGAGGHVATVAYSMTISAPTGTNQVNLNWNAVSGSIAGYNVFRGTVSGGPYSQINSSLVSSTDYSDSGVVEGTTYYYVTTSVNTEGEQSEYSNEAQAVVPSS